VVTAAADDAVPTTAGDRRAYPLVLAGMVTAVLEVETPVVDEDTEQVLASLLSTAAAALESAHLHSTAREQAEMDGLTQLPNRRRFEQDIDSEWERCRRYGRPLSLVMMDLDHFKRLNDEHGHLLGDQVLRQVAVAIGQALRSTDTAYRYGGEEIVVLLRETGLEEGSDQRRHRLGRAVKGSLVGPVFKHVFGVPLCRSCSPQAILCGRRRGYAPGQANSMPRLFSVPGHRAFWRRNIVRQSWARTRE